MFGKIGRKKLPATSTHQCFHLIYLLAYHMGCLGCEIKNEKELFYNKRYKFYGYIYRIIYLTGLIAGSAYKVQDEKLYEAVMCRLTPIVKVVLAFECILCPTVYITVTLYFDMHRETYIKLANTLQDLDEEMQKHFPHIQWNYHKSQQKYRSMTVYLYGYYALMSTIYVFYVTNCACGWISSTIISICYACVSGAPGFAGFIFIGNMDLLRIRFRLITKLLRQHSYHLDKVEDNKKFKLLHNFFAKYSSLITLINEVFCIITAASLFYDFVTITSLGYLLCYQASESNTAAYEYVCTILFMASRTYKLISIALYGYGTQKARRICESAILKRAYLMKNTTLMQQQTEMFLHWRMHNNYRLTVGKIINCNLSLIFLTLTSAVNYIMILIQLQFQQNDIVKKFNKDDDDTC